MAARVPMVTFNRIVGLGLMGPVDLAALVAQARARAAPVVQMQIAPHVLTPALEAELELAGLKPLPTVWAKMARPTEKFVPTGPEVVEAGADLAQDFADCVCAGFGLPAHLKTWLAALVGRPNWRCYVARGADGSAIAAAAMHLGPHGAWLGVAATLPEARGQGAQKALIRRRLSDAHAAGAEMAFTETGRLPGANPSLWNMQATGFTLVCDRRNWGLA